MSNIQIFITPEQQRFNKLKKINQKVNTFCLDLEEKLNLCEHTSVKLLADNITGYHYLWDFTNGEPLEAVYPYKIYLDYNTNREFTQWSFDKWVENNGEKPQRLKYFAKQLSKGKDIKSLEKYLLEFFKI
jgi:hypothetical protein